MFSLLDSMLLGGRGHTFSLFGSGLMEKRVRIGEEEGEKKMQSMRAGEKIGSR